MLDTNAIKNTLDAMFDSIGKDQVELYKKLLDNTGFKKIDTPEEFWFSLIYPYENFLTGLISEEIGNNRELKFLLLNYHFIERHFQKWIEQKEGSACSADKSRTIVSRLFDWFKSQEKIEWDYNAQYTFHMPKKIFTTHDDIVRFYNALKNLHYGNFKEYVTEINNLIKVQ